ncbi:hypothetical protein Aph01nite_44610 [Acrocarpospora phusangensis]|uniref:Uncharacterized protein n=1 Tax=Acrocarpospora phusangensis TaxID=1070424 RepID=A0A919QDW7_9ACTN|nr:hypothetical protein [Acrocarpospora phusangensis]GIH26151.1 hypothetical protein Aph01nite_44610 [Acrocarpospora phusangensis]
MQRILQLFATITLTVGLMTGAAAGAQAATGTTTTTTTSGLTSFGLDCGHWYNATCNLYFSRSLTRKLAKLPSIGRSSLGECNKLSDWKAKAACFGLVVVARSVQKTVKTAAQTNRCLKIRFQKAAPAVIVGWWPSGSARYCKN